MGMVERVWHRFALVFKSSKIQKKNISGRFEKPRCFSRSQSSRSARLEKSGAYAKSRTSQNLTSPTYAKSSRSLTAKTRPTRAETHVTRDIARDRISRRRDSRRPKRGDRITLGTIQGKVQTREFKRRRQMTQKVSRSKNKPTSSLSLP